MNQSARLLSGVAAASTSAKSDDGRMCEPGGSKGTMFPNNPLGDLENRIKVFIYGFGLLYSFIGVSIVADMFMSAIERITSKKRWVKVPGSANRYVTTNVWNETVANLTLMALGSSAPEILLAINDILKNKFHAGELGASTIVGSAAFNLFVIIAVCVNAIPAGETRQIKETGVFFITGAFSLFAYLWLLFIVQINTPDIVSVTEGALTFLFFPVLVAISYWSDAGYIDKWMGNTEEENGDPSEDLRKPSHAHSAHEDETDHQSRPGDQASRGGPRAVDEDSDEAEEQSAFCQVLSLICSKTCGLMRSLSFCATHCCKEAKHALSARCSRCAKKCRRRKRKEKTGDEDEEQGGEEEEIEEIEAEADWSSPDMEIVDEDGNVIENETGILTFKSDSLEVIGDLEEKEYKVAVYRKSGTDGRISCKYRMEAFTATPGYDYVEEEGVLDFRNGISTAEIKITILPKELGEKNDQFQIILEEPTNDALFNPNTDGGDDCCLLMVTILNANPKCATIRGRLFAMLDRWLNMDEMRQGSAAWYDQIEEAYYVGGSQEAQEEAKVLDWIGHVIFFVWQMFYAITCPPATYLGGWVCFVVSLAHIGILTAFIGDMAELFGCAAGIENSLTAITVVALGTSLPDLFASKSAATQDEWADASIVNVTGSNSVNVFLGIGLPWMMAAIYWQIVDGSKDGLWSEKYLPEFQDRCPTGCFVVNSGNLGFSVLVFTCFAVVCLILIRVRRVVYDGELGGPANSDSKACSSFLMILLWVLYISLSAWQTITKTNGWGEQILAIAFCIPTIILMMMLFGLFLKTLKISKQYIGEEGFFGIGVAVCLMILRAVYFLMFQ